MIVTVLARDSTYFVNVENIVVVIICVDSVIHAVVVVVTGLVCTIFGFVVVVVNSVVVDIEV